MFGHGRIECGRAARNFVQGCIQPPLAVKNGRISFLGELEKRRTSGIPTVIALARAAGREKERGDPKYSRESIRAAIVWGFKLFSVFPSPCPSSRKRGEGIIQAGLGVCLPKTAVRPEWVVARYCTLLHLLILNHAAAAGLPPSPPAGIWRFHRRWLAPTWTCR